MRRRAQSGYFLLVLLLMVAMMMMAVTAIAPRIAQQVKRDREDEMIHRGAEYARAIKRFYKKFGRYPNTLEQLENTNHQRFLRKRFADPMTEDGKWKLLHWGDVKMSGPAVGTPVSAMGAQTQQPTGLNASPSSSPFGSPGGLGSTVSTGSAGSTGLTSSTGFTSTTGPGKTTTSGSSPNTQIGGFIIGVASASKTEGIREFNDKTKYDEWYFVYDPNIDKGGLITGPYTGKVFANGSAIPGATPAGQGGLGQPIGPGGIGQPSTSGGFGQPLGGTGSIGSPPSQPKQ